MEKTLDQRSRFVLRTGTNDPGPLAPQRVHVETYRSRFVLEPGLALVPSNGSQFGNRDQWPKWTGTIGPFSTSDTRVTQKRKNITNLPKKRKNITNWSLQFATKYSKRSREKQSGSSYLPHNTNDLHAWAPASPPGTNLLGVKLVMIPTWRFKIFSLREC
jgi:hypothetical protein